MNNAWINTLLIDRNCNLENIISILLKTHVSNIRNINMLNEDDDDDWKEEEEVEAMVLFAGNIY